MCIARETHFDGGILSDSSLNKNDFSDSDGFRFLQSIVMGSFQENFSDSNGCY